MIVLPLPVAWSLALEFLSRETVTNISITGSYVEQLRQGRQLLRSSKKFALIILRF